MEASNGMETLVRPLAALVRLRD